MKIEAVKVRCFSGRSFRIEERCKKRNLGAEKDRLGKCQLAQHMEAFSLCRKEAKKPLTEHYRTFIMKDLMTEDSTQISMLV